MSRLILFMLLFLLPYLSFSQKEDFVIGLQSGNNFSRTLVNNEFDASPLKGDFFIGSSFGVIARSYLFKWKWGGFQNDVRILSMILLCWNTLFVS